MEPPVENDPSENQNSMDERDPARRYGTLILFVFVIVVIWYGFHLAEVA